MAVQRQFTSAGGIFKYKTVPEVAATLAFGISMSHAFENGNKRTALVSLLILLHRNRTLLVNASEDDLYSLITSLVKHELPLLNAQKRDAEAEVAALASWIAKHSREILLGDRLMRFSELQPILAELGCTFDKPKKNFIKIRCGGYSVVIGRPKHDWEIDAQEMKRIRKSLHLDEIHGLDSAGFYNLEGQVDGFVNQYRQLMDRLADQ